MRKTIICVAMIFISLCCYAKKGVDVESNLSYCNAQVSRSLPLLTDSKMMPRNITQSGVKHWSCTPIHDWTSGFWSGVLWYSYEFSKDESIRLAAERFSRALFPIAVRKAENHDLGFMMFCSLGNGYRLTGDPRYKQIILRAADSLSRLFNPVVGTINSWPGANRSNGWQHNTIIDNMLNLEMLFWAAKNGGGQRLYDIAYSHAKVTMNNQFRDDNSTCHVVLYDTISGKRIKQITHQGYSDLSTWARGQAWAVYGFTMSYRETKDAEFLQTAQKAADMYLKQLPHDLIPYWDFNAPAIPDEPRDASAAAIVASALLELSQYVDSKPKAKEYKRAAIGMLESLSSERYQSRDKNNAFLLHSTGHKPNNSEIDVPIIYADYYYIEALTRLKKMNETGLCF